MNRCAWTNLKNPKYIEYHDSEWGKPVHNDTTLFEFLILEGAQAGLTWETILNRREEYKKTFANYDYTKVAEFTAEDQQNILQNSGIVKNKLKVKSAINNAKKFITVQKEFGSFSNYLWGFVNNKPIVNKFKSIKDIPAQTDLSIKISKDLKKRGFTFVGPTIIYAYMQAVGIVNDHTSDCFLSNK